MRVFNNILVTGGCGFIGSHFLKYLFQNTSFTGKAVNLDLITYAADPEALSGEVPAERYVLEQADIRNRNSLKEIFEKYQPDCVVHFAAESHVDKSISGPADFISTNILGTFQLLETAREFWKNRNDVLFHHVSTDEVFGSLGTQGKFTEKTPYDPRSPYSASKASSDHLVKAYFHTYGLPVTVSNCSNNYGPGQFPEKLIPLMILNMMEQKPLPVYGDGKNVRDWLYVTDHCEGIYRILESGQLGSTYNLGGDCEKTNLEIIKELCELVSAITNIPEKIYTDLIRFIPDRPGHDRRYAMDISKIEKELGWKPATDIEKGLAETVRWYFDKREWADRVRSGEYKKWIEQNYSNRGST